MYRTLIPVAFTGMFAGSVPAAGNCGTAATSSAELDYQQHFTRRIR